MRVCVCVRRGVEEEDGEDGEDGAAAMARAFTHVRSAVWLRESVCPSVRRSVVVDVRPGAGAV